MKTILLDIDTQRDFMDPDGALYVPGAEGIRDNIARLVQAARRKRIHIVATEDYHPPDDPEFEQFPPHCVIGTRGWEKIPETLADYADAAVIEPHGPVPETFNGDASGFLDKIGAKPVTILRKAAFTVFQNPFAEKAFARLEPELIVVVGVATEYCVKSAALGLLERGYKVLVVSDAIKGITPEGERAAAAELAAAGAEFVSAGEALKAF